MVVGAKKKRESRASSTRKGLRFKRYKKSTKRVLTRVGSADFRHLDARYVARLSSPHAYIML